MNAKAKGARAERRARRILEAAGWTVVRAGGSLGAFDLVAFSRRGLRLVQVKAGARPSLRRKEREALTAFNNLPPRTVKELWIFRDRESEPRVEAL